MVPEILSFPQAEKEEPALEKESQKTGSVASEL
jgi:hypothetical protein